MAAGSRSTCDDAHVVGRTRYEGLLSDEECSHIVELFERSSADHYDGNTIQGGQVVVDSQKKRTVELDVKLTST